MIESFYEESAKVQNKKSAAIKYHLFNILSVISFLVSGIWAFIVIYTVEFGKGSLIVNILFSVLPFLLFIMCGIIASRLKNRFYVDYDYVFITGELRVSKVIKEMMRVDVTKFLAKDVEKIGKYGSDTYNRYELMPDITKKIFTNNLTPEEGKDFYYIVVNSDGKNLYIFECTEKLIVQILKYSNKKVVEEDFKWFILITQQQQNHL